jgi:hypothetical protein
VLPGQGAVATLAASSGLQVERVAEYSTPTTRWIAVGPRSRRDLEAALTTLESTHRIQAAAIRRLI